MERDAGKQACDLLDETDAQSLSGPKSAHYVANKEPVYRNAKFESVREIRDESIGLVGYLVIGSRINGLTCGGLRIHADVNEQELKDLAKVMELKQMFLGMPRGGSRAGIRAPYTLAPDHKQALMNRFAELVRDELVDRRWLVAIDIGTNIDLVQKMYKHVGIPIPKPAKEIANAGYFTALGVMKSIEVSLEFTELSLTGCKFAIEGMGNVGSNLFQILKQAGAKVIAVSNDERALVNEAGLTMQEGLSLSSPGAHPVAGEKTRILKTEQLLELTVDVLCPCATDSTINSTNVEKINAKVVCAGANNPVTYPAVQALRRRNILYLPDFITNSGGALGNMVKFAGLPEKYLHGILENELVDQLRVIEAESRRQNISPSDIAVAMLDAKFARMINRLEQKSQKNAIRELALAAYRRGLVPKYLMRPFAIRQIRQSIGMGAV